MKISASVESSFNQHKVVVKTNDTAQQLSVPLKSSGFGSAVNGGELLFLALATCFCNDIYREAAKKNMKITNVSVEASGEFGKEGEPGFNITYKARIEGDASDEELEELLRHTDRVAEIQNTIRVGREVVLVK